MSLISIGIDPGSRNAAIAVITQNLDILYLKKAAFYEIEIKSKKVKPKLNKETGMYEVSYKKRAWTNFKKLREVFKPFIDNDIIYTIEKVSARPGEGETTSFIFGNSLGIFQGQYSYLNPVDYYEPLPQLWKKEMGLSSDKALSIQLANDIFGKKLKEKGIILKSVNSDADLSEALLLALYGLIHYNKSNSSTTDTSIKENKKIKRSTRNKNNK